jgi:hypothetical protein
MREGVMTLISTGFAYETDNGKVITTAVAFALVPDEIAAQDEGQGQPVQSDIWLEAHGYHLIQLGVSQETALGWEKFDVAAFTTIAIVALGASFLIVDRRRPT